MKTIFLLSLLLFVLVVSFKSTAQISEPTSQDAKLVSVQVEWTGYSAVNIVIDGTSYHFRGKQLREIQLPFNRTLGLYIELPDQLLYAKGFLLIDPSGGYLAISTGRREAVFIYMTPEDAEQIIREIEPTMVAIQGGTFWRGCGSEQAEDCEENEYPVHQVILSDFLIGKYEVTQAQWRAVTGRSPSYFTNCDSCPVEGISWNEIQIFLGKLNAVTGKNYRLPTEAEWEYAARGGNRSKGYKYSGSNSVGKVGWFRNNSGEKTHPVGKKKPNELGIYDMTGNVFEWCQDWYGAYDNSIQTNPGGPSFGAMRVNRGGRYRGFATYTRVSYRSGNSPNFRGKDVGFRLAQ